MTAPGATCLRCDWTGSARAGSECPRCGAPVFLARESQPRAHVVPRRRTQAPAGAADEVEEPEPRRGPRAAGPLAFVAVSLLAALALILSQRHPHTASSSAPPASGVLVYSVSRASGTTQLYRWDLATGMVTPGPKIAGLESLSATARAGWLGVSRFLPTGEMQASVLKSVTQGATLKTLVTGRYVAFDAAGTSAVSVHEEPATSGCRKVLSVDVREISVDVSQRQYEQRTCAFVLSVARAGGTTYLSLVRGQHLSIDFIGYRVLHEILTGHKLESISSANDMLVEPDQGQNAGLFFRGTGALDPIPIAAGGQPLELAFVLAWSRDASTALVVGHVGTKAGIYEVEVGPGTSPRVPTFVSPVSDRAWASYAADGTAYVSSSGHIYALKDGRTSALTMPKGAPAPDGPVIWLPP